MNARALGSALSFVVLLVACSSDEEVQRGPVKDKKGRTCNFDSRELKATCDVAPAPASCYEGSTACFALNSPDENGTDGASICDGCCTENTSSNDGMACSPIVCTSTTACPDKYPVCRNGGCFKS